MAHFSLFNSDGTSRIVTPRETTLNFRRHVRPPPKPPSRLLRPLRLRHRAPQSGGAAGGGEGESPQADRELQPGAGGARGALRAPDVAGAEAGGGRARPPRQDGGEPPRRQPRGGRAAGPPP